MIPSEYPGEITLLVGKKKTVLWVHHRDDYEFWTNVFEHLVHFHYIYGLFRGDVTWRLPEEPIHSKLLVAQYSTFVQYHLTSGMPHGLVDENGGQVSVLKMVCANHLKNPEIAFEYQSLLGQYGVVAGQIYILTGVGVNTIKYTVIDAIETDGVKTTNIVMPLEHVQLFLQREPSPVPLSPDWIAGYIVKEELLKEGDIYL